MKNMITIFTPTYNRKELLKRCYDSLRRQTDKKFEWLIIDDGSVDNTEELVDELMNEADFDIRYIFQNNGGKHRAFNLAVRECKTEFLLILDSDDMLTNNAIELLNEKCKLIHNNDKVCGVIGNRADINDGIIIGTKIPDVLVASGLELYQKMNFRGDTLRLYKTDVLKRYPFPEIEGEKFVSENVVFDKIDQEYKMLVIPDIIYLCEYQESGLSNNIDKINFENPIGHMLSLKSAAETAITLRKRIGSTALYILWAKRFHINNSFRNFGDKFMYVVCTPLSFALRILKYPKAYFDIPEESSL